MKNNTPSHNIFSDLIHDHDRHRNMLVKIRDAFEDEALCKQLFAQFSLEVKAHAAAEEQALYGPIMIIPEFTADARHSVAEHKGIEDLINELADDEISHKKWIAQFDTLEKKYLHHINEEEEDELFPKLLRELPAEKQQSMGTIFEKRKPIEKSAATVGDDEEEEEKE